MIESPNDKNKMVQSQGEMTIENKQKLIRMMADKIGGVIDMDWGEIAEACKLDVHPDYLRKAGAGIRLVLDAGYLAEEPSPLKMVMERQKLNDIRREINEAYRVDARSEALRQAVMDAAKSLPPLPDPDVRQGNPNPDRKLVVSIADMHYGADWTIKGLHGEIINQYNPEVFEARMGVLLSEIYTILAREKIEDIVLLMAGDSLDGILRQSQLSKLRWGAVESCMRFSEYMVNWIASLGQRASVDVYCVDGNHTETRPLGSKKGQFENENLEKIIAWYIESRFDRQWGDTVLVHTPSEKTKLLNVCGYNLLLAHGDMEQHLDRLAQQAILQYQTPIDFFVCGHKHREQELTSGMTPDGSAIVIRVPSICGVDGFAMSKGYNGKPGALAMVMERGYGRRCMYPIQLA